MTRKDDKTIIFADILFTRMFFLSMENNPMILFTQQNTLKVDPLAKRARAFPFEKFVGFVFVNFRLHNTYIL